MRWRRAWYIPWILFLALWAGEGTPGQAWASAAGTTQEGGERAGAAQEGDGAEDWGMDEDSLDEEELSDQEVNRLLEEYFSRIDEDTQSSDSVEATRVAADDLKMEAEEDGRIRYVLPNQNYFISSVPCGMITRETVTLTLAGGTVGTVRRDDETEMLPDSGRFTQKGNYHVRLLLLQPPGSAATDYKIYEVNFYFSIIDDTDNTMGAVPAPEGFVIDEVLLDGRPRQIRNERCFFLEEDGEYRFRFEAADHEGFFVETDFVRDTQAPFLSFLPELEEGTATDPVEFIPSEPDSRVFINYNGSRGYAVSATLTSAGNYGLSVEDRAGNTRDYQLRIRQTYNLADRRLILAAVVLAAAGAVRLLLIRRNMKVL